MKKLILSLTLCLAASPMFANIIQAGGNQVDSVTHLTAPLRTSPDLSGSNQTLIVSDSNVIIKPTITVTASTYNTAGLIIGGTVPLTNAVRNNAGNGLLRSVTITDSNSTTVKIPATLLIFDTVSLAGTYTDRTTINMGSADAAHLIAAVPIAASDYLVISGSEAVASIALTPRILAASGSNALSACLITSGTGSYTMTGTATMTLGVGISQ